MIDNSICESPEEVRKANLHLKTHIPAEELNPYMARIFPNGMRAFISSFTNSFDGTCEEKTTYGVIYLNADRKRGEEIAYPSGILKLISYL